MTISIVPRKQLAADQLQHIRSRIFSPEHELDAGPRPVWDLASHESSFYAVILENVEHPIETIHVAGPPNATDVAWWLDSSYRRKGLGRELVDALAVVLKSSGVTNIGPVLVTAFGDEHIASSKWVKRLRQHFTIVS